MTPEQTHAFEMAAGTTLNALSHSIKLTLAVIAGLWIVWLMTSMYQNFKSQQTTCTLTDIVRGMFSSLLLFTVVLILIS